MPPWTSRCSRCTRILLFATLGLGAFVPAFAAPKRVIVISIDGLRGVTLAHLLDRHLETPNLNEFVAHGAVADGMIGIFPTVTYPSHTALVTGVPPDQHGILSNNLFDPEHVMNDAWYWYAQQLRVPAIWDVALAHGLRTAAVSWPVTIGAHIDANFPEWRIPENQEEKLIYADLCTPGLYAEYAKAEGIDPIAPPPAGEPSESGLDSEATREAIYLLHTRKPDLLLVHVAETDHEQHMHGPDSAEEMAALVRIDHDIGLIRDEVRASGLDAQTVFVVVSDHGFLAVDKSFHPEAVLTSLGLAGSTAHPDAWRVAAFDGGGSFGLVVHDPKDTEAMTMAAETFHQLASEGSFGIDHIYEGDALKATHGYSNSFLAVGMKPGYAVGGAAAGPWLTPTGDLRGMHGFAPGPVELDSSFVAYGPGIEARHLGRHRITDVAPTVASVLGFSMQGTVGTNILADR